MGCYCRKLQSQLRNTIGKLGMHMNRTTPLTVDIGEGHFWSKIELKYQLKHTNQEMYNQDYCWYS